jgi:UDP-N-acetylmuramoyl-L-alanyl-D-glutamate--2,6-diaminopimelate ligase
VSIDHRIGYDRAMVQSLSGLIAAIPHALTRPTLNPTNPTITGVRDDNRQVEPGNVFVAYRGVANDAHRFIPDAVRRGAAAIVCERDPGPLTVPVIRVPDGREAFAWLCAAWHGFPSRAMTVVGVTGTDGKTSTSNLIHGILRADGHKVGMISTVSAMIGRESLDTGLHTTTPKADDMQRLLGLMRGAGASHAVLEITSHGLAQHRVDGTSVDVGVITNITSDHLDLHGSREAYRAAKARLFEMARAAVLNVDDEYSFAHLTRLTTGKRRVFYSREVQPSGNFEEPWLFAPRADFAQGGIEAYVYTGRQRRALPLRTSLIGGFNVSNILAACGAALALGIPDAVIQTGIAEAAGVPGRMERIDGGQPYLAVVDFAHTTNSLDNVLHTLRQITTGRLIVVFGCAGKRDPIKRPEMGRIAESHADAIVLTSEDPRTESFDAICDAIQAGMSGTSKVSRQPERGEALRTACAMARAGDTVVVCGKGHEKSLCFGDTEYAWDDRTAMYEAIAGRAMPLGPAITSESE